MIIKIPTCFLILLMPLAVFAQNPQDFDPQQMQVMMQKAQEMQACMQKIDKAKMQAFQQRGKQMGDEIKKMCADGKRADAVNKALVFSKEIATNSAIQEMKHCSKIMQGVMLGLPNIADVFDVKNSKNHVCDEISVW